MTPKVVYIAGYGRSGSTVLDMLLSAQEDHFGAGELSRLFDGVLQDQICSCRRRYSECEIWSAVLRRLAADLPEMTLERAAFVTEEVERTRSLVRLLRGAVRHRLADDYRRVWRSVYSAIANQTGASVVVDSSKSNHRTVGRFVALSAIAGVEVHVVHLVRDPRGVMWSFTRGSNKALEEGKRGPARGGALRGLIGWSASNLTAAAAASLTETPLLRLRYEDLAEDASAIVRMVRQHAEVKIVDDYSAPPRLSADHGVAGNRLRRTGVASIRPDTEWHARLPVASRIISIPALILGRRYGYTLTAPARKAGERRRT